ncbi:uncharacterized protein N7496_000346 [Penicillium cataractarum]|uniref:DUF8021 domain-containing protein n=1 Tax=Penicillium cataractarum TaxID=2100454 RepID=A0A9W9VTY5_9EURO|nr:uncharacterized protein N7496_000346 [Penicillium cataractarum]KAJ5389278.1 hypothetical protein N7496_000346 [Penicillium cataractarum]
MVNAVLDSMVANDPFRLPLAEVYKATENTHPAALNMMALWRTVTKASSPSLLAIDITQAQAYFSLAISEGNDTTKSMLQGRIKVVDQLITEFEFYVNRGRGDDGFALDTQNLAKNYKQWMSPPANRQKATRAQLEIIASASFNANDNTTIDIAPDCQFTEAGWIVKSAACNWMPDRPTDLNYRTPVIDETLGIVVTVGVVPGKVYPYATFSAFIPNDMKSSQETQDEWYSIQKSEGYIYLVEPTEAMGTAYNVFQYYNNQLQGEQFNVYLNGPRNGTAWA